MKTLLFFLLILINLMLVCCSENSTEAPSVDSGKLVIKSTPPGAQIYFMGNTTSKITPDSITNLKEGIYSGFLYLQYYDTAYYSAQVFNNATTIIDTILEDGLPFVDFVFDYQIAFGGDSVRFNFTINQDVTMDSILVGRPIDVLGTLVTEKYYYNSEFFEYRDLSGTLKKYYLPPSESGFQYYLAIQDQDYYFNMFGHKAYGAKVEFRSYYQVGI